MPKPHNAAALPLPTSPPLPSPAILCTKRRTTSRRHRCSACPAPQTAIHAPVRGPRLNKIRTTHPRPRLDGHHGPCLDECHGPCLDGSHGPSLGGLHDLLHLTPTLCTKRRTASRGRRRSAFPAPQTAIHATPQHPGPNTPPSPRHGASPSSQGPIHNTKRRAASWCRHCSAFPAPQTAIHATPQHPGPNNSRTPDMGPHRHRKASYPRGLFTAAGNRATTRGFVVSDIPMNKPQGRYSRL